MSRTQRNEFYKYDYASNRELARIRHTETEYDKFDVFFNSMNRYRRQINEACGYRKRNLIDRDEFNTQCREIIADVNLYKKRNQKRFIRARSEELGLEMPFATDIYIKQIARTEVWKMMKAQNKRNEKRNRKCNG